MSPTAWIVWTIIGVSIVFVGLKVLRLFALPPQEPDEGELRKVNIRYKCTHCGTEIKMVQATSDSPTPMKHCGEEMEILPPAFE